MNIKKLEYFLQVCRHLSFAKAAEALYVSAQGVNLAVTRMEQELGTQLFLRTSKGLVLTKSGVRLQNSAKIIVNEYYTCCEQMQHQDIIYIACMHQLAAILPKEAQRLILGLNPAYSVKLLEAPSYECEEMLQRDDVDFAISCDPLPKADFRTRPLFYVNAVTVINRLNPLAENKELTISDLKDVQLAVLNKRNKLYYLLVQWARSADFTPKIIFEGGHPSVICELIRANPDIIGIIPEYYSKSLSNQELCFLPFSTPETRAQAYLLKNTSQVLPKHAVDFENCFVSLVREGFKKEGGA